MYLTIPEVDLSGYYTTEQVDAALELKANAADVYAKTETYNKEEADAALELKANAADVYTKQEIDAINSWKSIEG